MRKYSHIKSQEELSEAILAASRDVRVHEQRLKQQFSRAQAVYTPQALLGEGIRRATTSVSFYGAALSVISFLRKRLRKK